MREQSLRKSTQYHVKAPHAMDINHFFCGSLSKGIVFPQVDFHQDHLLSTTSFSARVDNKLLLHQLIGTGPETTGYALTTGTTTCGTSLYETVSSTSTSTTACHCPTSTSMPDSSMRLHISYSASTCTHSSPRPTSTRIPESELANHK